MYFDLKSQPHFIPVRSHQANSRCQLLDTTTRDVKSSPVPTPNTEREGNHPTPFLLAEAGRVTVPQEESGCFPQAGAGCVTSLRPATRGRGHTPSPAAPSHGTPQTRSACGTGTTVPVPGAPLPRWGPERAAAGRGEGSPHGGAQVGGRSGASARSDGGGARRRGPSTARPATAKRRRP